MWDSSGSEHHETPSIILHLSKANKTCLTKKMKLAMTSLFLPLALILATFWMLGSIESAGAVAVADPSNSRNYQDARSKVFRDVADNIISHSGARYGKRMLSSSTPAAAFLIQTKNNPTEWDPQDSSWSAALIDFCWKVNNSEL